MTCSCALCWKLLKFISFLRKNNSSLVLQSKNVKNALTKINQEPSIALPLVRRQCQDTGNVVVEERIFLLQKDNKKRTVKF